MTILETTIIRAIERVQAIKVAAHKRPTHVLLFADRLLQRVNHEVPVDMYTLRATLSDLVIRGHLASGPTINDTYYKVEYKNTKSSL